jgi:hypothetical protein
MYQLITSKALKKTLIIPYLLRRLHSVTLRVESGLYKVNISLQA